MEILEMDSDRRGFLLSGLGGLAGILGSCILFADIPIRQIPRFQKFNMKESRVFMVVALSLSAGVMVLAALWKVLTEASGYLKYGDAILTLCFLSGVLLCGLINLIMHKLTPLSIVQCAHEQEDGPDAQDGDPQVNDVHGGDVPNGATEEQPLLSDASKRMRSSRLRSCKNPESDCLGYSRPCSHCYKKATADGGFNSGNHGQQEADDSSTHHHHYEQDKSRLLRIGIQTALSLCIHKLPEGALVFASSNADKSLGLTIFVSLFVHNIAEGFSMAFPLYIALDSRLKAIGFATAVSLLQPLGALIAYAFLPPGDPSTGYGVVFAMTAGIMTAISAQLYETAVRQDTQNQAIVWFFVGMGLMGITSS